MAEGGNNPLTSSEAPIQGTSNLPVEVSAEIQGNDTLTKLSHVASIYQKLTVDDLYGNSATNKHPANLAAQERFLQAYDQAKENDPQAISNALALAPQALSVDYRVAGTIANNGKVKDALLLLQVQQEFNCSREEANATLDQQEKAIAHRRSELENAARSAQTTIVIAAELKNSNGVIDAFKQYETAISEFNTWNDQLKDLMFSDILSIKTHALEGITLNAEDSEQLNTVMENWKADLSQKANAMAPDLTKDGQQSSGHAFPILSTNGAGAQEMTGRGFTAYLSDHKDLLTLRADTPEGYISLSELKAQALLIAASENGTLKVQLRVDGPSWGIDLRPDEQRVWSVTGAGEVDYDNSHGGNWHDGYQFGTKHMSEEAINERLSDYPGIIAAMKPQG